MKYLHCDNFAQYPRDGTLKLLCMTGYVCSFVQQSQFGSKGGAQNEPPRVHSLQFWVQIKTRGWPGQALTQQSSWNTCSTSITRLAKARAHCPAKQRWADNLQEELNKWFNHSFRQV